VNKAQRRGPAPSAPIGVLAARAAAALDQERFKEAIELFKLLTRQEARPEWKQSLADAYLGRARAMAAKKMFKEAAMVLENTLAADGTVRDSWLYLSCLLRDGQQPKAAAYLLRCAGGDGAVPAAERAALEDLAAALLVAVPQLPEAPRAAPSGVPRWREMALASREALAAWINGASAAEMEQHLSRISLRSAFRPLRLLLKSLAGDAPDGERTRRLLETIRPGSPFHPLREAVEAVVLADRVLDAAGWERLTPAQQAFVAEARGLPAAASQFLARSAEAAQGGPGALFGFLSRQSGLPREEVRSACLNLLPQIPDRVAQFEKIFGPLPELDRHRIKALAAEARGDWYMAERSWTAVARAIAANGAANEGANGAANGAANGEADRQALLSQGVIYRHLAHLAQVHPEIEGGDSFGDPVIFYLERCTAVDPGHIPTVLELIGRYREEARDKDWHRLADEAIQRFPDDSQVLLQATESAVARKAYKKAAGFARRLLKINAINPGIRRQMIELQVAHARKQMRSKRPELAARELSAAAEWERPDAPSAVLRIARGLAGLQIGPREQAEAWLSEGVALAGGGAAGWFQARLEAELMKLTGGEAAWLRQELARACEAPPTKEAVMRIVSALAQPEARENRRLVTGLLPGMRAWLEQAAGFDWPEAEFQALAETLARFEAFDLLRDFARAGRQRDPANPVWRFHQMVARTRGKAENLSPAEADDLFEMAEMAAAREDFPVTKRIRQFLYGNDTAPPRRGRGSSAPPDALPEDEMEAVFAAMVERLPKSATSGLREMVAELGPDAAVAEMAERMRETPLVPGMPEPMIRTLARALVAKAMEKASPRRGGKVNWGEFF
jgi:hypothetical protein